jgi:hypothetical protein
MQPCVVGQALRDETSVLLGHDAEYRAEVAEVQAHVTALFGPIEGSSIKPRRAFFFSFAKTHWNRDAAWVKARRMAPRHVLRKCHTEHCWVYLRFGERT